MLLALSWLICVHTMPSIHLCLCISSIYYYIGDDEQINRYEKQVQMKVDGNLYKVAYYWIELCYLTLSYSGRIAIQTVPFCGVTTKNIHKSICTCKSNINIYTFVICIWFAFVCCIFFGCILKASHIDIFHYVINGGSIGLDIFYNIN